MIPDVSKALLKLKFYPNILSDISRGIEREALRLKMSGELSQLNHPDILGKSLTHPWITTDFSESLLEFVTPVSNDVKYLLSFLKDLHRYVIKNLNNELLWSLSMPCCIDDQNKIKLAEYGISNIGKFKNLYRVGLKNRYGPLMQIISGVHYNFSFPQKFWSMLFNVKDFKNEKEKISNAYLCLVRNYYRYGWIILYLFGCSPAVCSSFIKKRNINIHFEKNNKETYYLPYATSLRMSDIGYNSNFQKKIKITFNNLTDYIYSIKNAIKKKCPDFVRIGLFDKNKQYLQLNTNLLQIENELYIPIRPKRSLINNESQSDALLRGGIEYVEIRSLDINPFSSIGIDFTQVFFLDLFLIWCILIDAPEMDEKEFSFCKKNWDRIVLEGRKPKQIVLLNSGRSIKFLKDFGYVLFNDLIKIVNVLDLENNYQYYEIFNRLINMLDNPEYTYSGKILPDLLKNGFHKYGLDFSLSYFNQLSNENYEVIKNKDFLNTKIQSINKQLLIEQSDKINFKEYLYFYFKKNDLNKYFK